MNDKDRDAIDHVASVSKTHNARMIIEWLINGCVYDDYTDDDENITAIRLERRIEPKPAKPAYRVYKHKGFPSTYTQDRDSNGNVTHICCEDNVEFISEWIEYTKWPTPLVERIAAIDLEAAQWIVDHWDDLLDDEYTVYGQYSRDRNRLVEMFYWIKAKSSFNWFEISKKLGD